MSSILIIEDEFPVLETIKDILLLNGYDVSSASNGETGIQIAKDILPDLIVCDIYMPGLSGYEVLEKLRTDPFTQTIPFVFLSAKSDIKDLRKGMLKGADDYLTKPFTSNDLVNMISAQIEKHNKKSKQFMEEIQKVKYFDDDTGLGKRALLGKHLKDLTNSEKNTKNNALLIVMINRYDNIQCVLSKKNFNLLNLIIINKIKDFIDDSHNIYILGNGKFAFIINNMQKQYILLTIGDVLKSIKQPIILQKNTLHLSANIGLAYTLKKDNDLISRAEIALNNAVVEGQNNYKIYSPKIKKEFTNNMFLENDLHKALESEQFILYYQPKINLSTNKLSGFEALIRWNHPNKGIILPSVFIPLAESNGTINQIGEWVMKNVIEQINEWNNSGLKIPPIAINISVNQLYERSFIEIVKKFLEKIEFYEGPLEFELTENIFVSNTEKIKETLNSIKLLGIRLSLDDFGTGYSSLSYIKNFPFDKIKIDKSFINDIPTDENAITITTGIIEMSKKLGFEVIAEGVETETQADFLREHNCDEMQGFLYCKPLPAEDISKMIL